MKIILSIFLFINFASYGQGRIVIKGSNNGSVVTQSFIYYNVKSYGALGDNSTNNTTFIQNAINAVYTAGGGKLYFPSGTYKNKQINEL